MRGHFFVFIFFVGLMAFANKAPLVIYAADFQTAEPMRIMREQNPLSFIRNAWNFFTPDEPLTIGKTITRINADGSFTIFYGTLDDLLTEISKISKKSGLKIRRFNLFAHGAPGQVITPMNQKVLNSSESDLWRSMSTLDSKGLKKMMMETRKAEKKLKIFPGAVGISEWGELLKEHPEVPKLFTSDAYIRFVSCKVGAGPVGQKFSRWMASQLLSGSKAKLFTLTTFGVTTVGVPEGLAFWDFDKASDIDHANFDNVKPSDVRVVEMNKKGEWEDHLLENQKFLNFSDGSLPGFKDYESMVTEITERLEAATGKTIFSNLSPSQTFEALEKLDRVLKNKKAIKAIKEKAFSGIVVDRYLQDFNENSNSEDLILSADMSEAEMEKILDRQLPLHHLKLKEREKRISALEQRELELEEKLGIDFNYFGTSLTRKEQVIDLIEKNKSFFKRNHIISIAVDGLTTEPRPPFINNDLQEKLYLELSHDFTFEEMEKATLQFIKKFKASRCSTLLNG